MTTPRADTSRPIATKPTIGEATMTVTVEPEAAIGDHPATGEGAGILDDLRTFLDRFVVSEPEQADAVALWTLHSHAFDAAESTPRLSIQSAEKRSGKTRLLELL